MDFQRFGFHHSIDKPELQRKTLTGRSANLLNPVDKSGREGILLKVDAWIASAIRPGGQDRFQPVFFISMR
jgi:hypothetical protein